MKTIHQIILVLCCLVPNSPALAEHQTHLRGIVNVPGFRFALVEIHYILGKPGDAHPSIITNSWRLGAQEQFEDGTIKGAHFQFEVLKLDLAQETLKTREAGEEHTYSLPVSNRTATANAWLDLRNARFNDVIDLYSELASRVLLLHPALDRAPISLEAVWTNNVPERPEVTEALMNGLNQRGISSVVDGAKFLQLLPSALSKAASPRSNELPAGPAEVGGLYFVNVEANVLVDMYGSISGRRRTGSEWVPGLVPYLRIVGPLSKAEALYALETVLSWNGTKILSDNDNAFRVAPVSRQPKRQQ